MRDREAAVLHPYRGRARDLYRDALPADARNRPDVVARLLRRRPSPGRGGRDRDRARERGRGRISRAVVSRIQVHRRRDSPVLPEPVEVHERPPVRVVSGLVPHEEVLVLQLVLSSPLFNLSSGRHERPSFRNDV